jgi:hypothetical protein
MNIRAILLASSALALSGLSTLAHADADSDLLAGFATPPHAAKPQVWWHWIDGNISEDGAKLDFEWMQRIGLGGVHIFTGGGFAKPAVTDPVTFMSPEWKKIFSASVDRAKAAGMDVTIAGSPGWSETGGIWVDPRDAMKKYVWTVTEIDGGKPVSVALPKPSDVPGPFQNVARVAARMPAINAVAYGDSYVIAFPTPARESDLPAARYATSAGAVDMTPALTDDPKAGIKIPLDPAGLAGDLAITYPGPVTLGAVSLGAAEKINLEVLSSADGQTWTIVAKAAGSRVETPAPQQTFSFAPVTAKYFKLRITPQPPARPLNGIPLEVQRKPTPKTVSITRLALAGGARVNRFESKAGFEASVDFDDTASPAVDPQFSVGAGQVIDLTSKMTPDGRLNWTPPPGRWTVLRMGWSTTGQVNHPAMAADTGLEVDKLDPAAVKKYLDHYLSIYDGATGGKVGTGISALLTDSWEAGVQNWTPTFVDQFKARRGYDPVPYLPVLAGYVVNSAGASDRFLWDYRETLKEALADDHYGVLRAALNKKGMMYYTEANGDDARIIGDGMSIKARADIPTGELWFRPFHAAAGQPPLEADLIESASVAHLYGKPFVGSESFTVGAMIDPWSFSPRMIKPVADRIFAYGVNRILYHESMGQPFVDKKPGLSLSIFGQYFNRNETWADEAGPWITYLARNSYMLQQGKSVADIAYYYGEEQSLTEQTLEHFDFAVPDGYHYDFINAEALEKAVKVDNGRLESLGGTSYAVIYVPGAVTRYTLPTLHRLRDLVKAGAVLVAPKPAGGLGIQSSDDQVKALADEIWGRQPIGRDGRAYGAGRIFTSGLGEALKAIHVAPDNIIEGGAKAGDILSLHRRSETADIYFVSNQTDAPQSFAMDFRITGKSPTLWHATTGRVTPVSYDIGPDGTRVPLALKPDEAVYVVFDHAAKTAHFKAPPVTEKEVAKFDGPWDVAFEPGRGAPASARFDKLIDWTASSDPGIKYFSGAATYKASFKLPAVRPAKGQCLAIDLGEVRELAVVSVNGRELSTVWHSPYVVDATEALHAGTNTLEVKVVNLWPNRLIGDKQPGATPVTYAPGSLYSAKSHLLPSGMTGPVRVLQGPCPD